MFEVTANESNNRNPGTVLGELDDGAGMNYGTYSLTQKSHNETIFRILIKSIP